MKAIATFNFKRFLYTVGVILFVVGTIDPLEGSILITVGSYIISIIVLIDKKSYSKIHIASTILISIGVFFLFYFSSLGGFGGKSTLSWWYGLLVLPYLIGWLMTVVLLIKKMKRKKTTPLN